VSCPLNRVTHAIAVSASESASRTSTIVVLLSAASNVDVAQVVTDVIVTTSTAADIEEAETQ
jgi:hypothetical protein